MKSTLSPATSWRLTRLALAAALLACPSALAATAPDLTSLPLEQLLTIEVYSASKYVQDGAAAPALVTVISAAEIRAYGWRTLADIARSVRGQYVSYDRNYSYLGARGFSRPGDYNTRFLLLVDGNRVNDAVYDQAPLGAEFPLDLELVERVEFVPGPGSSIFGSNAFFGVINVVTKKPGALSGQRAALEAGSAGARRASVSSTWHGAGGADFLFAASSARSDGRDLYYSAFDTPDQNRGLAEGRDHERGERLFASAAGGPWKLTLMHATRLKGVPTASFAQPFNDPRSATTDTQTYANGAWRARAGQALELNARLFWGSYDSVGDYVNDDPARSINHDGSAARWWGAEASVLCQRIAGHTLLAGLDFQHDYRLHQFTFEREPFQRFLDERRSARRGGLYLQDEIALGAASRLNLGLRYDRYSGAAGVLSPRAALIHALTPDTTFKAIFGSAFRAPNSYERFYAYPGPAGQLPNPALRRETIRSSELALVQQLGERRRLTATLFNNLVAGLISQTLAPGAAQTRFENGAPVRAQGLELEYEQRWRLGAALRASYSHTRVDQAGDQRQVNAPARLAKFNLAAPLGRRGWRGALEAQYVGRRATLAGGAAGAFWLANANLVQARLWRNVDVSLGVYNLFDRRYFDPGAAEHRQDLIEQDGRSLRARIGYAF
jgi:outer membrane receptor protein involved in Fe transport